MEIRIQDCDDAIFAVSGPSFRNLIFNLKKKRKEHHASVTQPDQQ